MRKHKRSLELHHKFLIGLVVLIIFLLIIFKPFKQTEESIDFLNQTNEVDDVLRDPPLEDSSSELVGLLCEEYYLEQGKMLSIDKHDVLVEKIGSNSVKLVVDGEQLLLADGEMVFSDSKLRVALPAGKLLYVANDHEDNAVSLLVGCKRGENPNDKYVADKGEDICEDIYETCKSSFGIE